LLVIAEFLFDLCSTMWYFVSEFVCEDREIETDPVK